MTHRQARILLAKLGEGHDRSQLELAKVLSKAGFEVIYTDLQDPEAIVDAALQEGVDHIGLTLLAGAGEEIFERLHAGLKSAGAEDIGISAGGILNGIDQDRLLRCGVKALFPKDTPISRLVEWARQNIQAAGA